MNIQNIENKTIAKLTADEIGELGLLNHGVMTYRGELKTRVKGFKTVNSGAERHFYDEEGNHAEFFKIVSTEEDVDHWAMRIWLYQKGYSEDLTPLFGLKFLK